MSRLAWDQAGERTFQTGVDRGVLYLSDVVVPWNGITGVEEVQNRKVQPYFQDGVKYLNTQILGSPEVNLKAFTYPDEFDRCLGIDNNGNGVSLHSQLGETFGLSYRTLLGDDISGVDRGYIIHVMYNLTAIPSNNSYSSVGGQLTPMEFSWNLSGVPESISWSRPTTHVSINSTEIDAGSLEYIEDILYGSDTEAPYLPSITQLANA